MQKLTRNTNLLILEGAFLGLALALIQEVLSYIRKVVK